nr:hypothetical protein [Tanacetum cinerariifolium]
DQSTAIPNEPIPQRTGSGGSPRRQDNILRDRPTQTRVLALENTKTAQDLEITHLKKRVKRLEKKRKLRTSQLKRSAPITTAGVSISTAEPSTPPTTTTTTVIEDEDLIIAQTLMKIRSEKSKEKAKERGTKEKSSETATRPTRGVIMREASKTTTRPTVPPQQKLNPKDKEEERMARQQEEDVNIAEWDDVQAMMDAYHELAESLQAEEQGELTIEESFREVQKAFDNTMSWINSLVPMYSEVVKDRADDSKTRAEGSSKRAGEELESGISKRQKLDEKVEAEVDNVQKEVEIKIYMKINSDDEMLQNINRDDLETLWKLVKAKYGNTRPEEAYERVF